MTWEEKIFGKSHNFDMTWIRLVLVVTISACIAAFITTTVTNNEFEKGLADQTAQLEKRSDDINTTQCRSGNVRSAYELSNNSDGADRLSLVNDVLFIQNCNLAIKTGAPQPVTKAVQDQYVQILVDNRVLPLIGTDGEICATVPLPSSFRTYNSARKEYLNNINHEDCL